MRASSGATAATASAFCQGVSVPRAGRALDHARRARPAPARPRRAAHRALATQQTVRVVARRQPRRAHAQALGQQHLERALERALARARRRRRAARRCCVRRSSARACSGVSEVPQVASASLDTGAAQRDLVEVALDDHGAVAAPDRLERARQAVERLALVEDRRLRRVQVLRLLIRRDRAPAEAEHAAARVADREGHAPAQPVVVAARAARRQDAGGLAELHRDARAAQHADREVPAVRREADLEALPILGRESARREIRARPGSRRAAAPRGSARAAARWPRRCARRGPTRRRPTPGSRCRSRARGCAPPRGSSGPRSSARSGRRRRLRDSRSSRTCRGPDSR